MEEINSLEELLRMKNAKKKASEELMDLYEKMCEDIGEEGSAMIMAYQAILEDTEINSEVKKRIMDGMTAENALKATAEHIKNSYSNGEDEYMKARKEDIDDVVDKLMACLREERK